MSGPADFWDSPDDLLDDDFLAQHAPVPKDEEIKSIAQLVQEMQRLEKRVARTEEVLKLRQKQLAEIAERKLPMAMELAHTVGMDIEGGLRVEVGDEVYTSITKANEYEAYNWLRKNGHDGMIKNHVIAQFGKGEDARATELAAMLAEHQFNFEQKLKVEPQTLKAFVKRELEKDAVPLKDGEVRDPLPRAVFGVFTQKVAKLKKSKGSKK